MKHAFVDNLVMLAELTVKPDKIEEFLDYTVDNLKVSRSYPGNIAFEILIDENEPYKVLFYEVWESPKTVDAGEEGNFRVKTARHLTPHLGTSQGPLQEGPRISLGQRRDAETSKKRQTRSPTAAPS